MFWLSKGDSHQVFIGNVVVLVLGSEVVLESSNDVLDLLIYFFVPGRYLIQNPVVLLGLNSEIDILSPAKISNHVFLKLFDTSDAFQYISNIVDAPFLNLKNLGSLVKVNSLVGFLFDQVHKFLGEDG
jgi:hypothetical protein